MKHMWNHTFGKMQELPMHEAGLVSQWWSPLPQVLLLNSTIFAPASGPQFWPPCLPLATCWSTFWVLHLLLLHLRLLYPVYQFLIKQPRLQRLTRCTLYSPKSTSNLSGSHLSNPSSVSYHSMNIHTLPSSIASYNWESSCPQSGQGWLGWCV